MTEGNDGWAFYFDRSRDLIVRGNTDINSARSLLILSVTRSTVTENTLSNYVMIHGNYNEDSGVFPFRDGIIANNQWSRNLNNPVLRLQRGDGEGGKPFEDNGKWLVTGNRLQPGGSIRVRDGIAAHIVNNFANLHSDTLSQSSATHANNRAP